MLVIDYKPQKETDYVGVIVYLEDDSGNILNYYIIILGVN